ncbi:MAG: metallophosphoesterase [Thiohalomonadales bacterium]
MRIALLSDIHGNDIALQAVLDDIKKHAVDRIICLGDVATLGPSPIRTLQMLRDLNCSCILGNHDAFLLDAALIHSYTETPEVVDAVDWCRELLTQTDFDFLNSFIPHMEINSKGAGKILLYHGSPSSHMEEILATTTAEQLDRHINGDSIAVMAGGHTHVQMMRQYKGVLIVNPGSVGYPFKEFVAGQAPIVLGHAEYAIIELSKSQSEATSVNINLRRIGLDIHALIDQVNLCQYPMQAPLLEQYRRILN